MTDTPDDAILTEEQVHAFERDGAVMVRGVLDAGWLARLEALVEDLRPGARSMSRYEADRNDGYARAAEDATFLAESNWRRHETARALVFDSPLPRIAAEGLRSRELRVYEDLMMYRRAGSETPTVWHQDSPLRPLKGAQMASIWFSLDPMTPATGALRFVAGSHRGPAYEQYMPEPARAALPADAFTDLAGPLPDMQPGDVILFSPKAIHATYGSHSDRPKRSFSIRYMGDDIRWRVTPYAGFHRWMKEIALKDGDRIDDPNFPLVSA
jgi:ectoine hydroxylase-related dioxygenase (phytanoyl-CoA dioxygenase family)